MTTVGKVGSSLAPSHAVSSQAAAPKEKTQTPKAEFQAILNQWAHTLPVAFINRLEKFSADHLK